MIENASQFPKIYYCRHMQPGIAGGYEKEGTILVDTDAVKRMLPTAVGKPVYLDHQNVKLDSIKGDAGGYITEAFYNEMDGWGWFKFLVIDDECHKAIEKGYAVSNAYIATETVGGGTKNNCPYNSEIKNGEFTHLAIVSNPRYEGARIFTPEEFKSYQEEKKKELNELQNSKGKKMFNLFKNVKEKVTTIDSDTMVELENGTSVKVSDMVAAITNSKANKPEMINVDGDMMSMDELVNKYCALKNKKAKKNEVSEKKKDSSWDEDNKIVDNDDGEESEGDQEDEGDDEIGDDKKPDKKYKEKESTKKNKKAKKNSEVEKEEESEEDEEWEDGEKNKKESKEKKNSIEAKGYFNELRNANLAAERVESNIEIGMTRLQRGKARYGKQK